MRRMNLAAAAAIIGLSLSACQQEQAAAPEPAPAPAPVSTATVFQGATLIPADGRAPIENGVLIIDGGTIVSAAAAGAVEIPEGATIVDVTGQTIMPAIYDTHVHLSGDRAGVVNDLIRRAVFGVGAAQSMGRDPDELIATRSDLIPGGARYFSAGRGITRPEPGRPEGIYWIESAEEGVAAVQHLASVDVDVIKIWVDDRNGQYDKLTPEMYGAIIEEATALNVRVMAHIYSVEDAKGLLRAGLPIFAHGIRDQDIDDETMGLFAANPDTILSANLPDRGLPTDLSFLEGIVSAEALAAAQGENVEDAETQELFGIQARNLDRLHNAGVTVTLGTDGNTPWAPHLEIEDMVAAGLTPMEAITVATHNSAELLGINGGVLSPTMDADFLVLDGNPLDDITNTRAISSVYLRGEEVDRSVYP
jgi:imidazolonepropionase-like amidohydrolase